VSGIERIDKEESIVGDNFRDPLVPTSSVLERAKKIESVAAEMMGKDKPGGLLV
jgi:uncharacterized protein YigA (DUF484 family)